MPTPNLPHPIGIKVYGLDNKILSDAIVTLTLGSEVLSETSNSSGEVIFNTADLPSGWNVGDTVSLTATKVPTGTITSTLVLTKLPQTTTLTIAQTSELNYVETDNMHVLNFALLVTHEGSKVTEDNPLPVNIPVGSIKDYNMEVAMGNVPGTSFIHKFGNAPDFDTGDGAVDIWDGANDAGSALMSYTYSSTANIDSLSSSDGGDTEAIEIQGLDSSFNLVVQTVTLTGQTRVAIPTPLIRVFRLKNVGSTDIVGRVYCFVNVATTGGVPNTLTNIRAEINNGNNQTLMCIFTIPNNKTGYLDAFDTAVAGAKKTAEYQIDLFARPPGQVFQLKHRSSLQDGGTTHWQHKFLVAEKFVAKTDIVMRVSILTGAVTEASVSAGFDLILVDN